MKEVYVTIVGCGGYSNYLVETIKKSSKPVIISGLVDIDLEKARSFGRKHQLKNITLYNNAKEAFLDISDIIVIATPPEHTPQIAYDAIKKGKAVFCEKPMALNVQAAKKLVDLVESTNGKLQMDFPYRFMDALQEVKRMIDKGEVEYPISIQFSNFNEPHRNEDMKHYRYILNLINSGASPMNTGGSHYLDLFCSFMKSKPVTVSGTGTKMKKDAKGNTLEHGLVTFEDGSTANILLGWLPRISTTEWNYGLNDLGIPWPAPEPAVMRIYAPNMTISFDYYATRTLRIQKDRKSLVIKKFEETELNGAERYTKCISKCWESFVNSVLAGKKPTPNEKDGLVNVVLANALDKAIKTRTVQSVEF